jgi:hypothetical protein
MEGTVRAPRLFLPMHRIFDYVQETLGRALITVSVDKGVAGPL